MKRMAKPVRALLMITVCGVLLVPYAAGANFDFYLLVLSWAPNFCAEPGGSKDPRECGMGRRIGFVVHGMWPQANAGRGPERCGPVKPVPANLVQVMLRYIPTDSLIQHEWSSHGTCSGLSASDYFTALRKARDSVRTPEEFDNPQSKLSFKAGAIEKAFADANPTFPASAFRVSCYPDGSLQEVRICINKDLTPRACPASVGSCSRPVTLLPPR